MTTITELRPEALYTVCDPAKLGFSTTEALEDFEPALLHPRAMRAMQLGLGMRKRGYSLFVLGESGSGRHAIVRQLLEQASHEGAAPEDWCYVNDFSMPGRARLLQLPCGRGKQLRNDMQDFVGELGPAIAAAFESDQYRERIEALQEEEKTREENALHQLGDASQQAGLVLLRTPRGFIFAPLKNNEETYSDEEFAQLPEERQREFGEKVTEHYEKFQRLMNEFPRWRRNLQKTIKEVGSEVLMLAVGHLLEDIKPAYADLPVVMEYLDAVLRDIMETGESLHGLTKSEDESETTLYSGAISVQRYLVNLLVENSPGCGRPVVMEDNPTLPNLVGRIDHHVHMGTLVTHFTLIKAGALHRANGGFLVLDVVKVLSQPYAWEGLKRALHAGEIRIESVADLLGMGGPAQLQLQPVPLNVKVVLIGERIVYYLLAELDPDFAPLFKINADLESEIQRTPDSSGHYARLIATMARQDQLRPLSAGAVARLIEHAARLAGDAEKLSTRTLPLCDLLQEADHLAGQADTPLIERTHVEAALEAHRERHQRVEERYREDILRGLLLIDTSGTQVGQTNGLAVIMLGAGTFAHPVRITATVRMGEGEIIDIEREAELGGPIHSKGVLILSSFLAARFGWAMPLSLCATLVFEQSYGGVEGDSASLAELASLLSALSGLPIRQSVAVSGSVNQFGVVQPVGGINEKIEGFFDVCAARGLTGEQGVLIPAANVCHLMLRENVVAAVREGHFHIWAVRTIDEAMECLTGVSAGEPDEKGEIPAGTINFEIAVHLAELAQMRQSLLKSSERSRKKKTKAAAPKPDKP
ncbi:Lon protease family protein [Ralstonia sp. UBA689]|uniref:Lon protease family protein n=1 Tax=Ralstonia sp. UBA689 TaxID=1947373 RepID=UPI0025F90813|nr:ATP-binding protein [Ralstonia sp. UBA689]